MVYHIADEIRVGVMVMQDDILVGKHWPKNVEETPEQWVGYNVWGDHGFFYTSETMPHLASMKVPAQWEEGTGEAPDAASGEPRAHSIRRP